MNNRYINFIKNLSILTISNFLTKFIMLIMLPLYTNILTTEEYGVIDIIATTTSLATPIFTLCITEAIIRYSIGSKNSNQILNEAIKILFKGFTIVLLLSLIAIYIGINKIYIIIFLIYYLVTNISSILTYYLKGLEKLKVIGIASIIRILVLVSLNCLFLIYFKLNIVGYYLSLIISELVLIIIVYFTIKKINIKILDIDKNLSKTMLKYSTPLVFNSIGWWINHALDKYLLLFFHGMSITGIYSMAHKIPSFVEVLQNVFAQAWKISAIKEYNQKNSNDFFSTMYTTYNLVLVFLAMFLILFVKIIAKIMFAKEFYVAWKYSPLLLIAILFGALSGFLEAIYAAYENSKLCAISTTIGAIINLLLNLILIPNFDAIGAAAATAISYIIVFLIRILYIRKYIYLKISYKVDTISYILLILMSINTTLIESNISIINNIVITIIITLLNINNIKKLMYKLLKKANKHKLKICL